MLTSRLKRQREVGGNEESDEEVYHDRKKFRSLPFRTPSTPRQSTAFSQNPSFGSTSVQQPLTPIESSEDDLEDDLDLLHNLLPSLAHSSRGSSSSASSIKVAVGDEDDMDLTDSQPREIFSSPLPWQRSRANDMLSPPQLPHLLNPAPMISSRRIDTPTYGHFNTADFNMQLMPQASPSSNVLSPVIREEEEGEANWWRRRHLRSPTKDPDEVMTPVDQGHGTMERLNTTTANVGLLESSYQEHSIYDQPQGHDGQHESARPGRLTMGFRADCDKCVRRIPGHYSHIIFD